MSLFYSPPHPDTRFIVAVPARNEVATLLPTLHALAHQTDDAGRPLPFGTYEVLLLANNCTDQTADVARDFALSHPDFILHVADVALPREQAHAGGARRLVMECAAQRFYLLDRPPGMICATDADTRPFPTWLHAIGKEASQGVDAVCGRILVEKSIGQADPARAFHVRDTAYRLLLAELEGYVDPPPGDPLPRHFQHFGASFAITARALYQVGGVPSVPVLEDVALFEALEHHALRVRHAPNVRVETSARRCGRAAIGLSTQFAEWDEKSENGQPLYVDDPACLEEYFHRRKAMRVATLPTLFPGAWKEERLALPPPAVCEVTQALAWLRERLQTLRNDQLFSHKSRRYVSARKPVTCRRPSSERAANAS